MSVANGIPPGQHSGWRTTWLLPLELKLQGCCRRTCEKSVGRTNSQLNPKQQADCLAEFCLHINCRPPRLTNYCFSPVVRHHRKPFCLTTSSEACQGTATCNTNVTHFSTTDTPASPLRQPQSKTAKLAIQICLPTGADPASRNLLVLVCKRTRCHIGRTAQQPRCELGELFGKQYI